MKIPYYDKQKLLHEKQISDRKQSMRGVIHIPTFNDTNIVPLLPYTAYITPRPTVYASYQPINAIISHYNSANSKLSFYDLSYTNDQLHQYAQQWYNEGYKIPLAVYLSQRNITYDNYFMLQTRSVANIAGFCVQFEMTNIDKCSTKGQRILKVRSDQWELNEYNWRKVTI